MTPRISRAAARFGHDVFDVCTMICLGEELDAAVADWSLYLPIYRAALELEADERSVAVPRAMDPGALLRARSQRNLEAWRPYQQLGDRALFAMA